LDSPRRRNNRLVRAQNTKKILMLVKDHEPVSLETLVRKSSLTYPTVLGIIKQLESDSHVERLAYAPTTGGRQAVLYGISGISRYVLGLHINTETISISITNLRDGKIFQATEPMHFQGLSTPELARSLVGSIGGILSKTRLENTSFVRVCITHRDGTSLDMQGIGSALETFLSIPVKILPDRIALNYLERQSYHISSLSTYMFVLFEEELSLTTYRGFDERLDRLPSTHFGHMTMVIGGATCVCSQRGCLCSYVNGEGLLKFYLDAGGGDQGVDGESSDLFHRLLAASYRGDRAAVIAIDRAIEVLAVALANVIKIEGVATIVLSGIFNSTDVRYKMQLEQTVANYLPKGFLEKPQIILGTTTPNDSAFAACLMMSADYFESLRFD